MSNSDGTNNIIDLTDAQIAKMRNLKPYKGWTDDEIRLHLRSKKPKIPEITLDLAQKSDDYDIIFNERLKSLQKEFALDMNDANDAENLKALVRQQIQLEKVNKTIDDIQRVAVIFSKEDTQTLKYLGDFQRSVITSINEFQEKLGITRKLRKEKQADDIPQWIESTLEKSKTFFERKTVKVECPRCMIELARYWLNFPKEQNDIDMALTCWKCKEVIMFTG